MSNRFRLDTGCIIDQQENKVLSDVQVRNLLNKLNDENEQLKQYINYIHALYEDTYGINMENEEWWEDE